jgi:hypothetical protein
MRDRYDAELWNQHHDQFSKWLDEALGTAGRIIRRTLSAAEPAAGQLLAVGGALSLTLLTFAASAA